MRIISGIYRSRILKTPSGNQYVRPTTDRARETVFNILSNRMDFEGMTCLDLFCGTGSMGLEFLSRSGGKCTFVDINTNLVRENANNLKLENNFEIIRSDVFRFLSFNSNSKYDIAFADPPYKFESYERLLKKISDYSLLFILEHDKSFKIPDEYSEKLCLQKKIGISFFSFFDFKKQQ
jgi:16S rRNA (guanine966-N2)-methyltransferase